MTSLLRRSFVLFTIIWLPHLLWSQDTSDVILGIRERYYSITNELNQLSIIKVKDFDFYLKNSTISIVKTEYEDGLLEFYYIPHTQESYTLYFIFFNRDSESDRPDIRVYLNDDEDVVLTKFDDVEVSYLENRKIINELILKSSNALNTFFNLFEIAKNHKTSTISQILNEAVIINKRIGKTDTVEYFKGEEGGYYEQGKFEFYNVENQLIKSLSFHAGEHGSSWNSTIFSKGKRICTVMESVSWAPYFNLTVEIVYYEQGMLEIRKDIFNSRGVKVPTIQANEALLHYNLKDIVPEIKYN